MELRRAVDRSDDTLLRSEDEMRTVREEVEGGSGAQRSRHLRNYFQECAWLGTQRGIIGFWPSLVRRSEALLRHLQGRAIEAHRGLQAQQPTHPPEAARLFLGPGLCEVYADAVARMWSPRVDVDTAFYQHQIPTWVSELFALELLNAGELGLDRRRRGVDRLFVQAGRRAAAHTRQSSRTSPHVVCRHYRAGWTKRVGSDEPARVCKWSFGGGRASPCTKRFPLRAIMRHWE